MGRVANFDSSRHFSIPDYRTGDCFRGRLERQHRGRILSFQGPGTFNYRSGSADQLSDGFRKLRSTAVIDAGDGSACGFGEPPGLAAAVPLGGIEVQVDGVTALVHGRGSAVNLLAGRGVLFQSFQRILRALRNGSEHLLFAVNQRRSIVAGEFESVAMCDGVRGAGLHAVSAEDAPVVIDVVNLRVALAAADAQSVRIFGSLDINAIRRTCRRAEETSHAFLQAVFVAL